MTSESATVDESASIAADAAPRKPRPWSLTAVLAIGFGGLVAISVGAMLAFGLTAAWRNTDELRRTRAEAAVERMNARLFQHVDPAVRIAVSAAAEVGRGSLDPADDRGFVDFASSVLAFAPQIQRVTVILPTGSVNFLDRETGSSLQRVGESQVMRAFPEIAGRIQATLEWARRERVLRWLPPQWNPVNQYAFVATQMPLHRGDQFLGVVMVTVTLAELSAAFADLALGEFGTPFLVYGADGVVAHPSLHHAPIPGTPERPLAPVAEVDDPVLRDLWSRAFKQLGSGSGVILAGDTHSMVVRAIDAGTERRWHFGVHYPGTLVEGEQRRVRFLIGAGVILLAAAVVGTLVLGRWLARPMRRLAVAAGQVDGERFDHVEPLRPSRIAELDQASGAFNRMVDGLRERERIRSLFGRYVPAEVAKAALDVPDEVLMRVERRTVSVLFSDIQGFTTLSESQPPEVVVELLNQYFDRACAAVDREGGIVVDFIGDAVFALFGAPIAHTDHPERAARAALGLARAAADFAAETRARGLALGRTRIGLHTGTATVGNVGSAGRVKYAATGDTVNTGARLEGANKLFGTGILASAGVVADCRLTHRPVGRLVLKGRTTPMETVELLPRAIDGLDEYRAAYAAMAAGADDARDRFAALAARFPDDGLITGHRDRLARGESGDVIVLTEK